MSLRSVGGVVVLVVCGNQFSGGRSISRASGHPASTPPPLVARELTSDVTRPARLTAVAMLELEARLKALPHAKLARMAASVITALGPDAVAVANAALAEDEAHEAAMEAADNLRLWRALPIEVITRIVELAHAASLPVLSLLESRTHTPAMARLAKLYQLLLAQANGLHVNHRCEKFDVHAVLGVPGQGLRYLTIYQMSAHGMRTFADALSAGAFPEARNLGMIFTNLNDASLCLLPPLIAQGALPLLEELCLEANQASDPFMIALSRAAADCGALRGLLKLNLSLNYIGDAGVEAFASACMRGAFPRLFELQLRENAPLGDAGLVALATVLDDSLPQVNHQRPLPSLTKLLLGEGIIEHPKLVVACRARGNIRLYDGSNRPAIVEPTSAPPPAHRL